LKRTKKPRTGVERDPLRVVERDPLRHQLADDDVQEGDDQEGEQDGGERGDPVVEEL
jgi:hypothetical protein